MKKLGKKLCYFAKVFLVLGLLFSNLSSLSVVFAYEGEDEEIVGESYGDEEDNLEDEEENLEDDEEENLEDDEEENLEDDEEENLEDDKEENLEDDEEENLEDDEEENLEDETNEHDYTKELNESAQGLKLDKTYLFSDEENGKVLYVVTGVNDSEVENIINNAFGEEITGEIIEDEVVLTDGDNEITYQVVVLNNDYLNELMNKVIENKDTTSVDDINKDGKVDNFDVAVLRLILKDGFGSDITKQNVTIESKLEGETVDLNVGDTFTVQYILTLSKDAVDGIAGHIKYNKDMLTLDKVEVKEFNEGKDYEGKFLYFGNSLMGTEIVTIDDEDNEVVTYSSKDYVVVVMTFTVISAGNDTISVEDIGYFNGSVYYEGNDSKKLDVNALSNNNSLDSLSVAGNEITLDDENDTYSLTVGNDVTEVNLEYVLSDNSASISSVIAPEELNVGENEITITIVAENGDEKTYTIIVTREEKAEEKEETEEVASPVSYQNNYNNYNDNNDNNDNKKEENKVDTPKSSEKTKESTKEDESKLSRIVIIVLIVLAIAGLIYLIFRDEDDAETKKANKEIDKFKKEDLNEIKSSNKIENNKKTKKKGR